MSGYTKLFSDILTSSIWNEDTKTRILWITILAMCDAEGYVHSSKGSLAHMARLSPEDVDKSLQVLESPDPDSRSEEYEGRRIEKVEGGWLVLNYEKHRNRVSSKPEDVSNRIRQKRYREKNKPLRNVTLRDTASASVDASVSLEGESEGEKAPKKLEFGEFKNVKLTEEELNTLIKIHGNPNVYAGIEVLGAYMEGKGKRYKNHYAVLNRASWVWEEMKKKGLYKTGVVKSENEEW